MNMEDIVETVLMVSNPCLEKPAVGSPDLKSILVDTGITTVQWTRGFVPGMKTLFLLRLLSINSRLCRGFEGKGEFYHQYLPLLKGDLRYGIWSTSDLTICQQMALWYSAKAEWERPFCLGMLSAWSIPLTEPVMVWNPAFRFCLHTASQLRGLNNHVSAAVLLSNKVSLVPLTLGSYMALSCNIIVIILWHPVHTISSAQH